MKITDSPITVEYQFNNSLLEVWRAITNLEEMKQWFFEDIPSFKAEAGFETSFIVHSEARTFTHLWKITSVTELKQITYSWRYKEYPGDSFLTFKLVQENEGVMLQVRVDIIADFPDNIPEFDLESCRQGWHYFIGNRLKGYLRK